MQRTICGVNCGTCGFRDACGGCAETGGRPFGSECVTAMCCRRKGVSGCASCASCATKEQLIGAFNALGIADMETVTSLNALKGSIINMAYTFESGQTVKLFDDNKIYLGNLIPGKRGDVQYGLAADDRCLLVCACREDGSAELIAYRRRLST